MLEHQRDMNRMEKLFDQMTPIQKRVAELSCAFELVNHLNAIGAFKRVRADRAIANVDLDDLERQRQQLERDVENVDWLAQASSEMLDMVRHALKRVGVSADAVKRAGSGVIQSEKAGRY